MTIVGWHAKLAELEQRREFIDGRGGQVHGTRLVDRRKVVVNAGGFTVRFGSDSGITGALGQELSTQKRAVVWQLSYVRLLDSAGSAKCSV
jgi:hypothetical protein